MGTNCQITVIPAFAGIQVWVKLRKRKLDSRVRGNDSVCLGVLQ